LTDFRLGGVDRGFQIVCGDSVGQSLIVLQSEVGKPFLEWNDDLAERARRYVQQYHNLRICGTPDLTHLRCIGGDSFTIRTLIVWMIESIFKPKGLPHCPSMHSAFICRGTGYSVYTVPTIGSIDALHQHEIYHGGQRTSKTDFSDRPLTVPVARTLMVQLLVILRELTAINFSHGTPSLYGLVFTKDPVSYQYDGFHVEGPLTVQITDLWNASATFNQVHYFTKDLKVLLYLERTLFAPDIETRIVSMAHCHEMEAIDTEDTPPICPATLSTCPDATTYALCKPRRVALYRLTRSTMDIYGAMRHIGFPLYVGSFDFYSFMVSLMCDPSFYATVTHDDRLYRLWSMMWLVEDLPRIETSIQESHRPGPRAPREMSNLTIDIIRGAWLRCDIVNFMWSLIKIGW
jgi:hypothetical protein